MTAYTFCSVGGVDNGVSGSKALGAVATGETIAEDLKPEVRVVGDRRWCDFLDRFRPSFAVCALSDRMVEESSETTDTNRSVTKQSYRV